MQTITPLFRRGDVAIEVDGRRIVLALTPRACALIEEKTGAVSYMDSLSGLASQDGEGGIRVSARKVAPVMAALLEAAGEPAELADQMNPLDAAVIISTMLSAHLRPAGEDDENPQPAAGIGSTPVA